MKKDIEWLKEEIGTEMIQLEPNRKERWVDVKYQTLRDVAQKVNQLDEPEVNSQIDKLANFIMSEVEGEPSQNQGAVDTAIRIIKSYQNQETLSQEWIDRNKEPFHYFETKKVDYYVSTDFLQNLLVPKQEVTIGKEDAENIVQYKEMGWTLSHLINDYGEDARHDELLAKAWLAYPNIEVEEEQKYYVLDSEEIPLLERVNNQTCKTTTGLSIYEDGRDNSRFELTEQEIKDYDDRYMTFAVKVEELEE